MTLNRIQVASLALQGRLLVLPLGHRTGHAGDSLRDSSLYVDALRVGKGRKDIAQVERRVNRSHGASRLPFICSANYEGGWDDLAPPSSVYWNSVTTLESIWFACFSAAIPVCCRMLYFDRFAVACPMSADMMLFSALVRF